MNKIKKRGNSLFYFILNIVFIASLAHSVVSLILFVILQFDATTTVAIEPKAIPINKNFKLFIIFSFLVSLISLFAFLEQKIHM
jgi:hypothetical protein